MAKKHPAEGDAGHPPRPGSHPDGWKNPTRNGGGETKFDSNMDRSKIGGFEDLPPDTRNA